MKQFIINEAEIEKLLSVLQELPYKDTYREIALLMSLRELIDESTEQETQEELIEG